MGEEGVALEHVAEAPRLGGQMESAGDVVEDPAVDDDPAGVRAHEAGQALEGEALPGPGRAEEGDDLVPRVPGHVESEARVRLVDGDIHHGIMASWHHGIRAAGPRAGSP